MASSVIGHLRRAAGCSSLGGRHGLRSLRFKASGLIALLLITAMGVRSLIIFSAVESTLQDSQYPLVRQWALSLASRVASELAAGNRDALTGFADEMASARGVNYVILADRTGRVLVIEGRSPHLLDEADWYDGQFISLEPQLQPEGYRQSAEGVCWVDTLVPVLSERDGGPPQLAGYLRLGTDVSEMRAAVDLLARQLMWTALVVLAVVVPSTVVLMSLMIRPLNELARTARAIAGGSLESRSRISSRDEMGELATSFNTMADRLMESRRDLLKLNAQLEERVRQRTQALQELAERDPLTGLYNRRYFGEVLIREFASAERHGDDLTVLMLDVDLFKQINDRFGHRTGDGILITLAAAIAGQLRVSDVAARFGGDEFILLLPQTSAAAASALCERIVTSFISEAAEGYTGINPTVSIGVASLRTTRAPSSEALVHEADVALYAAKEGGRNRTMEAAGAAAAG